MQEGSLRCDANVNVHVPQARRQLCRDAHRRDQEPQQHPRRRTGHPSTRPTGSSRNCRRRLGQRLGTWACACLCTVRGRCMPACEKRDGKLVPVAKATAGWDDTPRRHRGAAAQGGGVGLSLFSRARPGAGSSSCAATVEHSARRPGRIARGAKSTACSGNMACPHTMPACWPGRGGRSWPISRKRPGVGGDAKEACNWAVNDLLQTLNEASSTSRRSPCPAANLGELIREVKSFGPEQAAGPRGFCRHAQ